MSNDLLVEREHDEKIEAMMLKSIRRETTVKDYEWACKSLVDFALSHHGSSGRICAQLLLSAHNNIHFQFPIADLYALDTRYLALAIHVIRGRAIYCEPHEFFDECNSSKFDELYEQWKHLKG